MKSRNLLTIRTLLAGLLLTAILGVGGTVMAQSTDSMPVTVRIGGGGTPTVTPTEPPATHTPVTTPTSTPADGGGTVTQLPSTGGSNPAGETLTPMLLLLAGGGLLAIGWTTRRREA